MGNVSSRPDDGAALYLRDPNRRQLPLDSLGKMLTLDSHDIFFDCHKLETADDSQCYSECISCNADICKS